MTDDEVQAAAEAIVKRTRREQDLPRRVEDTDTLAVVASVLRDDRS
jgi:hypothetical protein